MERLLEGVRILDLTRFLAGPYGTLLMGDVGAEIIKIEDPGTGDPQRQDTRISIDGVGAYFLSINRNKKSVTIDLRQPEGREVFYDLVRQADVVFDNFRPSVLTRLRVDYETLRSINPRIICCSLSAFGHTAPEPDRPAYDLILQALGGTMSITGEPGRPPTRMGVPMGDLAGGMFGAFAISAALFQRERTGQGCKIDISLVDAQVSLLSYVGQFYLATGDVPQPQGSGHLTVVPYGAYKAADGYVAIAVFVQNKFWVGLCRALGRMDLAEDPRFSEISGRREHRDELNAELNRTFGTRTVDEWLVRLREADVPSARINTVDRALALPEIAARQMVVDVPHPHGGTYRSIGNPIKVEGVPDVFEPAPEVGEDTDRILSDWLGYAPERLRELHDKGAI